MRFLRQTLRRQILLITVVVVLSIQILFGALNYHSLKENEYHHLSSNIETFVEDTLLTLRDPVYNFDNRTVLQIIDIRLSGNEFPEAILIYQEDNTQKPFVGRAKNERGKIADLAGEPAGSYFSVVRRDIVKEGRKTGSAAFFFSDRIERQNVNRYLWQVLSMMAVIVAALVAALFFSLNRLITKPILDITAEIENAAGAVREGKVISSALAALDERRDEIGGLHRAMSGLFGERTRELTASRDSLEKEIAERRQAQENLKKSEERLQSILDNAMAVIFLKDTAGRYLLINRRFENLFNVSREAIWGKTDHDIFPAEAADAFRNNDLAVLKAGSPMEMEEIVPQSDGPHTYISIKFPLYDHKGEPYGVCGVATDITERKLMEEGLRRAMSEAEEATRLKDEYVSIVSHDLRSPLGTLLPILQMIHSPGDFGLDEAKREEFALDAIEIVEGLAKLISELLDVSRFKTGKVRLDRKFLSVYHLANSKIDMVYYAAEKKGISVRNDLPRNMRFFADETLVGEVLGNLLSNAIKFTPKGGTITLFSPEGRPDTLAVRDSGVGIGTDRMEKIFRQDVKTSTPGTEGEKGTGLGLPFCRDIVAAHGGELTVASEEGMGTTFFVTLPRTAARVLIVDDVKAQRNAIIKLIEDMEGLDVLEASNGREALETLRTTIPHIIVADLRMPVMDGFAFLEELRKNPLMSHIPVIIVTSSTAGKGAEEISVRNRVFALGAADFVTKPLSAEDFIPRVRRYLG